MTQSKYKNKKAVVDNVTFHSIAESERYLILKMLSRAGKISGLRLQPKFMILDDFMDFEGKKHRKTYYIADFKYMENGKAIVEDVKGYKKMPVYQLKKKMFLKANPNIVFREIL